MIVRLTDREVDALIAPWWRKLAWHQADWRALDRARSKIRAASGEHVAQDIIAELRNRG